MTFCSPKWGRFSISSHGSTRRSLASFGATKKDNLWIASPVRLLRPLRFNYLQSYVPELCLGYGDFRNVHMSCKIYVMARNSAESSSKVKVSALPVRIVRLKEAATYLGMSPGRLRQLAHNGEISFIQLTPQSPLLFDTDDLIRESTQQEDERKAQKFLQRRLGEVATGEFYGPKVERIGVSELAVDLLHEARVTSRKSHQLTNQRWHKHIEPFFGALRAKAVTTDLLNR